ncbi:hypothetical protein NQ314_019361 [Rhamnusium bicolor]|uniref:Uncharacterized protein n=1 Tax=Rhamnusium bicolor TaxID=1586634 RepID=A0AAV8WN08_9CUCU|nr:hypothetical protein NQ314_019361 [Rhamnusium bicolor]
MALELLLLCALIFIFIVSFCGLLQKIKQSYDRERMIADRITRRQAAERNSTESLTEVYVNSAYLPDVRNDNSGIFPAAPPPYSQNYMDPPPNYEDVIKTENIEIPQSDATNPALRETPDRSVVLSSPPPLHDFYIDITQKKLYK